MKNSNIGFKNIIGDEKRYENIIMMALGIIVGIITGIASIIFNFFLETFHYTLFDKKVGLLDISMEYKFILIPVLGGLMVGAINKYFINQENEGFGVSQVLRELKYINRYLMKPKVVMIKTINTIITLGSGLSAGRQGPIVHLGGAIGSALGYKFQLSKRKVRTLIGCGVAGSIAGVFNTPISATIFVLEILMNKDSLEYFTPIVISSITSVILTRGLIGDKAFFNINSNFGILNYKELLLYLLLGVLLGLVAVFYINIIDIFKSNIKKVKLPPMIYPAIGGLIVAIIGYFIPQIFDIEYGTIGKIVEGDFGLKLLILMFVGKLLATAATLGAGGVGGVFLPGLYLGAAFGAIYGSILNHNMPSYIYNINTYSLVGMGAMFAAFADAPITATLILLELTDNYSIILPILLTCAVGSAVTKLIYKETIYTRPLREIKKD